MIFNIKDFGAVADGKTLNTAAIQNAIDTCFENGGGQVLVEVEYPNNDGIHINSSRNVTISRLVGEKIGVIGSSPL